jgi:hypothetical protein
MMAVRLLVSVMLVVLAVAAAEVVQHVLVALEQLDKVMTVALVQAQTILPEAAAVVLAQWVETQLG